MTGEVERLKAEEAQAALDKKKTAEALMEEVHRSNAEQVVASCRLLFFASSALQYLPKSSTVSVACTRSSLAV